jgi:hypothetical protein
VALAVVVQRQMLLLLRVVVVPGVTVIRSMILHTTAAMMAVAAEGVAEVQAGAGAGAEDAGAGAVALLLVAAEVAVCCTTLTRSCWRKGGLAGLTDNHPAHVDCVAVADDIHIACVCSTICSACARCLIVTDHEATSQSAERPCLQVAQYFLPASGTAASWAQLLAC